MAESQCVCGDRVTRGARTCRRGWAFGLFIGFDGLASDRRRWAVRLVRRRARGAGRSTAGSARPCRRSSGRDRSAARGLIACTVSISVNAADPVPPWRCVLWFEGGTARQGVRGAVLLRLDHQHRAPDGAGPARAGPGAGFHILYLRRHADRLAALGGARADLHADVACVERGGAVFVPARLDRRQTHPRRAIVGWPRRWSSLERANAAKSDFLATISHEIRTPMNAVVAAGALLRRTLLTPPRARTWTCWPTASRGAAGPPRTTSSTCPRSSPASWRSVGRAFAQPTSWRPRCDLWRATAAAEGVVIGSTRRPARAHHSLIRCACSRSSPTCCSNATKFTDARRHHRARRPGRGCLGGARCGIEVERQRLRHGPPRRPVGCSFSFEQGDASASRATHGGTGLGLAISRAAWPS